MRFLFVRFLLVVVLAWGCTSTQARRVQRVTEVTLAASLVGILACVATAYAVPAHDDIPLAVGLGLAPVAIGSALVYVAVDGMANNPEDPPMTERDRERATAWDLARQAKRAARTGDCAQVQAIQPRVRELDQEIYGRFLRDKVIGTCLAPPPSAE